MFTVDTLKQRARERLLEKLTNGQFPPGTRVSELQLAKELGTSRGPIREAVSQLASEGLIEQVPGVGAFVKDAQPQELADLYDFRDALESYAAAAAATRISPGQLAQLRASCRSLRLLHDKIGDGDLDEQTDRRWVAIDAAFHGTILAAAGNPLIQRHAADSHFLRRIWCQQLNPAVHDVRQVLISSYQDHRRIVAALVKRDARAARRTMSAHIQDAKRRFVEQLTRARPLSRHWPTPPPG